MINLSNISQTFHKGKANEIKALININLEIKKGEYVVIIGANGSGKSTLLNIIAGNQFPDKGNITINDVEVSDYAEHQRSKWIARIFQNPLSGTAPDLSIIDNFRLAALRTQNKNLKIGINNAFIKAVKDKILLLGMGLENKLDQAMGSLSGGQRQALTLIMAIMDEVNILLLDEPTAALDPKSAEILMQSADNIIKQYNLTAILVTHNIKDAQKYGNRIIQMSEGTLLRDIATNDKKNLSTNDLYKWFE
jgi:putative ABC transport system ATP-binding protein